MKRVAEPRGRAPDGDVHAGREREQRAPDKVLEVGPENTERVLRARARALSVPIATVAAAPADAIAVLGFRAGGEGYAVEARHVVEIRAAEELVAVPQTPPFLLGVVNVSGRIQAVVDVPTLLGSTADPDTGWTRIAVLEVSGFMFAIAADTVDGLGEFVVASPAPRAADHGALVRGVNADLVALLDLEAIVTDSRFTIDMRA